MLSRGLVATPVGDIHYIVDEVGVRAISAPSRSSDEWQVLLRRRGLARLPACADEFDLHGLRRQLSEYINGERRTFYLPLCVSGTPFQLKVWEALQAIPYGEVRTYADIAREIGSPLAARAVGQANNQNPFAIVVPCHRVVVSSGLGGYAGGPASKEFLLALEKRSRE